MHNTHFKSEIMNMTSFIYMIYASKQGTIFNHGSTHAQIIGQKDRIELH